MNFFSAENIIIVVAGFIATTPLAQWLKKQTGAAGGGAMFLAFALSFGVAVVGIVVASVVTGNFTWDNLTAQGLSIFAFATMAYKLILADRK